MIEVDAEAALHAFSGNSEGPAWVVIHHAGPIHFKPNAPTAFSD
jgi:hypothetical protein